MSSFTMATHQIWSCRVTLAANFENLYFSPNSILNFWARLPVLIGGSWLKNKKLQAKSKTYRIKVRGLIGLSRGLIGLRSRATVSLFHKFDVTDENGTC